jgi:hypothetical protein
MGRLTVRFFAGLGRALGGIFKAIVRHPVGTVFSVLIIGGLVYAWIALGGFGFNLGENDSSVLTQEQSTQATGKSEDFMNAFGKLDANTMWSMMSDSFKDTQKTNGIANADAMQKAMNAKVGELAKGDSSKPRYRFIWNNGRTNSDGSAFDVFQGSIEWPKVAGIPKNVLYGVTTDKNGNISGVLSQVSNNPDEGDPILNAAFPVSSVAKGETAGAGSATSKRNPTTEELMAGLTNFDAKKVWNTFSPAYQKELTDRGVTVDNMQKAFDGFKKDAQTSKTKLAYVGYTYQVTTNYPTGVATDTYVAALQYQDRVQQFQYIILLDNTGKITAIGTDDPILSKGIGRSQQGQ